MPSYFGWCMTPSALPLRSPDYASAVERVAQTSLREMIGSSVCRSLLSDRKSADNALKESDRL